MGTCVSRLDGVGYPTIAPLARGTADDTSARKRAQPSPASQALKSGMPPPLDPPTRLSSLRTVNFTPPSSRPKGSQFSTTRSAASSSSGEGPFTGYNPAAWFNSGGDGARQSGRGGDPHAAHRKSASIAVLERISKERASCRGSSFSRSDDYLPLSDHEGAHADSARKSLSARTRRLSSKMNDIPIHMEKFLPRGEDEGHTDYLHRVFKALDTGKKGVLSISEIVRKVFQGCERDSIQKTLSFAANNGSDFINAKQFIKFFGFLSGDNCIGPEVEFDSESDMGLSSEDSVVPIDSPLPDELSKTSSLTSRDTTSARPRKAKTAPVRLRDVRVRYLLGEAERIKCIALSPDARLYAVSHRHDRIAHIRSSDGVEVRRLAGHGDSLLGIAFSPDRKYVATASRDKLLIAWDCTVGLECHSVEHPGIVTAVAFAHDGKHVYTGCQDNLIRKLTFPKGRLRATIPTLPRAASGVIASVSTQHTQNNLVVFSRSCDEYAYVARADSLSLCMQLNGHETLVWQTAFSVYDDYIFTCCERKIIVWRVADFTPVGSFDATECSLSISGTDQCLWTTAVFGPSKFKGFLFAFNTQKEMIVLNVDAPEDGPILEVYLRSGVYSAATSEKSDAIVCGDDLGNVYRIMLE